MNYDRLVSVYRSLVATDSACLIEFSMGYGTIRRA